jgi:hypothetical protein
VDVHAPTFSVAAPNRGFGKELKYSGPDTTDGRFPEGRYFPPALSRLISLLFEYADYPRVGCAKIPRGISSGSSNDLFLALRELVCSRSMNLLQINFLEIYGIRVPIL